LSSKEKIVVVAGTSLLLVSVFLPVFSDPFYHEEKVDFWTWVGRELYELVYGEKKRAK